MLNSRKSTFALAGALALGLALASGAAFAAAAGGGGGGGGGGGATGGTDVIVSGERAGPVSHGNRGGRGNGGIIGTDGSTPIIEPLPLDPHPIYPFGPVADPASGARETQQRCVQYRYLPGNRVTCERIVRR